MVEFERCFIMLCNDDTEGDCLGRNLFGDKAKRLEYLDEIKPGDIGFLLNVNQDELIGIYKIPAFDPRFSINSRLKPCYLCNSRQLFRPDGVNSAILLAGWVLMRSRTSRRYSNGSISHSLQLATRL